MREPRAPRVAARLEVAYEDRERQVFLAARDVSASGLYLLAPDPPPVGVPVRVTLELPDRPALVRLAAVVVRREPGIGFAVRFDGPVDRARNAVRAFTEPG